MARPPQQEALSPGQLYREIEVSREEFGRGEERLAKRALHPFVGFCRSINSRFPGMGKGAKFTAKTLEAVQFLGWDLSAEEFAAASKVTLLAGVAAAFLLGTVLYISPLSKLLLSIAGAEAMVPLYIYGPLLLVALYLVNVVQGYPMKEARAEQVKALTYVPEIVGYMIMSIKLVPNLEKAVEFAAEHGRGKIAEDFKKILWDMQLGVYTTLSEALDALAYRWGSFSEEFKLSLMRVRASVVETTEAKRYAVLDNTMAEILESIRNKMEQYARDLSQPSTMLFYIGVLLPLILIIILPVGSTFSGAALANPVVMFLVYDVAIPAIAIWFAVSLIKQRPPTYEPPHIPDNYPGLPRKNRMLISGREVDIRLIVAAVFIAGLALSMFVSLQGMPPKFMLETGATQLLPYIPSESEVLLHAGYTEDYFMPSGRRFAELMAEGASEEEALPVLAQEKQIFFMKPANDLTPTPLIFGILITVSLCAFVYLYYTTIYKRRVQLEIMQMESEFKDTLYVLASRMAENRPVEEAIKYTKEFLPNLKISQTVFSRTLDNISLLGMPLESAVFDPNYGSLKDNPSATIRSSMRLLIDSVQLGVNVAARTLMSLSMQLANSEKVNKMLAALISDVNGMMKSMATFIAPMVLGITTSLQKIVILTIASIATSGLFKATSTLGAAGGGRFASAFSGANLGTLIRPDVIGELATPTQFVFIVAIYVVELVLIMTYFTTKIEEDNDLLMRINIAKTLPIAVASFVVSMFASNLLIGGFMGG